MYNDQHPIDNPTVTIVWFWFCAIFGTAIGGSLFGIIGGPVGMIFGFLIALAVGVPIQGSALALTLVGPLAHFRFAVAILAGGLTGVFSSFAAFGNSPTPMITAAFLGSATTFVTVRWFFASTRLGKRYDECRPTTSRYTLSEVFIFLTIVAALCGGWSIAGRHIPAGGGMDMNPGQLPTQQDTTHDSAGY